MKISSKFVNNYGILAFIWHKELFFGLTRRKNIKFYKSIHQK